VLTRVPLSSREWVFRRSRLRTGQCPVVIAANMLNSLFILSTAGYENLRLRQTPAHVNRTADAQLALLRIAVRCGRAGRSSLRSTGAS